MANRIVETLVAQVPDTTVNLKPVYIGTLKKRFTENPNGFSVDFSSFILDIDSNYNTISDTIICNLNYWKYYTNLTSYTQPSDSNTLTLTLTPLIHIFKNFTLVCLNGSNQIIFSSNINNLIYSGSNIISITLDDVLVAGSYHFKIISKVTELISSNYNQLTNEVTLTWTNLFLADSFISVDSNQSNIEYFGINKNYSIYELKSTDKLIDDFNFYSINALGLAVKNQVEKSTNDFSVIHIPDETYIDQVIEDLSKIRYGYCLTPIQLSFSSIDKLQKFIDIPNNYYSLIISAPVLVEKIISTTTYVAQSGVDQYSLVYLNGIGFYKNDTQIYYLDKYDSSIWMSDVND